MKENKNELKQEEMNQTAGGGNIEGTGNRAYCIHPSKHYIGGSKKENGKTLYRYECDYCHNTLWREEEPGPGGVGGSW